MFLKQRFGIYEMEARKYTESLFHEIILTAKYMKKTAEQLFKKLELELTNEEFSTLDFLYENNNICQRDVAIKMFVNRANMGKILNGLEKKGYIKRTLDTKCNHPAKIVTLTKDGENIYKETIQKLRETGECVTNCITENESNEIISCLHKMRKALEEIVEVDI